MKKISDDLAELSDVILSAGGDERIIDAIVDRFNGCNLYIMRNDAIISRHHRIMRLSHLPVSVISERTGIPKSTVYWVLRTQNE